MVKNLGLKRKSAFDSLKNMIKTIYDISGSKAGLHYHLWPHTARVLKSGKYLAKGEGISYEDIYLLKTAIILHDVGNILGRKGHEDLSIDFVKANLPYFSYNNNQIEIVSGLIKATEIPQMPKTHLEKIMCDADLSLIGLETWSTEIDGYRKELGITDLKSWYGGHIKFWRNHNWFTETAKSLYDEGKKNNILLCEKVLS